MEIQTKEPKQCSAAEIEAFCTLVRKGDEVESEGLEGRVRNARLLAFGRIAGSLAGVVALKNPNVGYRAGVFAKAQSDLEPGSFGTELGWAIVDKQFRRQGH